MGDGGSGFFLLAKAIVLSSSSSSAAWSVMSACMGISPNLGVKKPAGAGTFFNSNNSS
jgi:hypothetical protein